MLIDRVKLILASGLSVIVDFHPSDMHPDYTGASTDGGRYSAGISRPICGCSSAPPALLDALRSAGRARAHERAAGAAERLAADAAMPPMRRRAAARPICFWFSKAAMRRRRRRSSRCGSRRFADDPAALLSFHYYEPYQFTHQGASWNPARYLADVPYPARARPLDDSLDGDRRRDRRQRSLRAAESTGLSGCAGEARSLSRLRL